MAYGAELIAAGAALAGTAGNAAATGKANRKNRRFTREMFNATNEYNAPLKQVERMKAANLNPALMYNGTVQNTTTQPSSPKQEAYHVPENLMSDVALKLAQKQLTQSQTPTTNVNVNLGDAKVLNTAADTTLKTEQTELTRQASTKAVTETARIQQEYNLQKDLFNTNKQYRQEELKRLKTDVLKLSQELEFLPKEQQAKIELMKNQAIESLKRSRSLDNTDWIFKNEKELREMNINPNGNVIDTIIKYIVGSAIGTFKEIFPSYN